MALPRATAFRFGRAISRLFSISSSKAGETKNGRAKSTCWSVFFPSVAFSALARVTRVGVWQSCFLACDMTLGRYGALRVSTTSSAAGATARSRYRAYSGERQDASLDEREDWYGRATVRLTCAIEHTYKGGPNSVSKNHISFRCQK